MTGNLLNTNSACSFLHTKRYPTLRCSFVLVHGHFCPVHDLIQAIGWKLGDQDGTNKKTLLMTIIKNYAVFNVMPLTVFCPIKYNLNND